MPYHRRWLCLGLWALFVLGLSAVPSRAAERYFVLVFGSQREIYRPKYTHSFATFVRATGEGPCLERYHLDSHTISWLPETLDIRVWSVKPEPGSNLDLHATLRYVLDQGERISCWGPFEIDKDLYDRSLFQAGRLERDEVGYNALNRSHGGWKGINCIRAVCELSRGPDCPFCGVPSYGEAASRRIARYFRRWMIDPACTHDWLLARMGLDRWPLLRQELP